MTRPQRAKNDYATHLPILVGLGSILKIRRVLEFGCGLFSTITFLNRAVFPDLLHLDSIESDITWLKKIENLTGNDIRLYLQHVDEPMEQDLENTDLSRYDLILVDNSTDCSNRSATIRTLAERKDVRFAVIHDFEIDEYRRASAGFSNWFEFCTFLPSTGVVWSKELNLKDSLETIQHVIDTYVINILPDDVDSWVKVFQRVNK